jgi:hypothetical protein
MKRLMRNRQMGNADRAPVGLESPSPGYWQVDEIPTMRDPAHIVQIGRDRYLTLSKASGG